MANPVTHLEKTIAGEVTPVTHLEKVIAEYGGGDVYEQLEAGTNILIEETADGKARISASGEVSSEDTVARAEIAAIKDGETLDSFGDVETALIGKANTTDIPTVPITAIQKNGTGITPVSGTVNITVPTQASDINAATATQGSKADTAIQGIKVNSSTVNPDSNKVVSITVPTSAADVSALPNTTKYAAALSLTINSSTYVMTGQLKDQNGDNLGTAQIIDLPLESVVVGGSYDSQTKKVVLTLQNGNTIEFSVADLVSGLQTELSASNKLNPAYINYDSTHRAVSDTEKSTWNNKQNAIDSSHKLSADLVDDTSTTNKFATAAELEQINTNKNNISLIKQVPTVGSGDNGKVLTAGTNGEYSWVTINKDFIEGFLYDDNFYSDYSHTTEITGDFDKIYLDLHTDNIYYFDDSGTGDKYHYIGLKPYESKSAASGGTDVSLCTTGEKYTWNNKSNLQLTSSTTPIVDGTATIGSSTYAAKADHVHPTDTSRQAAITAQSPLSADVVSDTNTTHKFVTQTQLDQISTNANNIFMLEQMNGAKNLAPYNSGEHTGNAMYWFVHSNCIDIAAETSIYFVYDYTQSDGQISIQLTDSNGNIISGTSSYSTQGTTSGHKATKITVPSDKTAKGYNAYHSANATVTVSNFMIVPAEIYEAGFTDYQPYAMTNAEITAWILSQS